MADRASAIFNKRSAVKLRNPDDLDKHVHITNPSVWIVLAVCVVGLIGLLVWSVVGTVTTNVNVASVFVNDSVVCFLPSEKAGKVHVGDEVNVAGEHMTVESISAVPVSPEEAKNVVKSDYLVSALVKGDWTYIVRFTSDEDCTFPEGVPLSASITTEKVAPISLILRSNT